MRPPQFSTIFLVMDRPMPVPEYSSLVCRRWNNSNILVKYSSEMPMPLSATQNSQWVSVLQELMMISGGTFLFRYLSAFEIRFWNTCLSGVLYQLITGSSSRTMMARDSLICRCSRLRISCKSASISMSSNFFSRRLALENSSRSRMICRIRLAPSVV